MKFKRFFTVLLTGFSVSLFAQVPLSDSDTGETVPESSVRFDEAGGGENGQSESMQTTASVPFWIAFSYSLDTGVNFEDASLKPNPLYLYDDSVSVLNRFRFLTAVEPVDFYRSEISFVFDVQMRLDEPEKIGAGNYSNQDYTSTDFTGGRDFGFFWGMLNRFRFGLEWENLFFPADNFFVSFGLEYLMVTSLPFWYSHRFGTSVALGSRYREKGYRWYVRQQALPHISFGEKWGEISSRTTVYGEYDFLRLMENPPQKYSFRLFSDTFFNYGDVIEGYNGNRDCYLSQAVGIKSDLTARAELMLAAHYWYRDSAYYDRNHVFGLKAGGAFFFESGEPSFPSFIKGKVSPRDRYAFRVYYWGGWNFRTQAWDSLLQVLFDFRIGGEPQSSDSVRSVTDDPDFPPMSRR